MAFDFVTPRLAVGARVAPEQVPALAGHHRIRHVIDLREEERDDEALLAAHGIALLHLPTPDRQAISQDHLDLGVSWAIFHLMRERRVLVHCQHGVGRSALLALCILVELGEQPLGALEACKRCRPCISPSPEQLEAYLVWLRRRASDRRAAAAGLPSFDELAAIAYRHLGAPRAP